MGKFLKKFVRSLRRHEASGFCCQTGWKLLGFLGVFEISYCCGMTDLNPNRKL